MHLRALPAVIPPRLQVALGLFGVVIVVGTGGYLLLTDMSFVDALYQTVTTLSTVGFRELATFDTKAKLFTVVLILFGVGTVLYTLSLVMEQVLEGDLRSRFYARRMTMQIAELSGHYILCGFGRVGQEIARELKERGVDFVVIEQTAEQYERARAFGYLVINGDASDERVLNQSNLRTARCLLAASDSDAGNTYITLTAKSMNPGCHVVARCGLPHNEEKLRLAGPTVSSRSTVSAGGGWSSRPLQPLAADFMDTLASGRHGDLVLAEFEVNPDNALAGRKVGEILVGCASATLLGIRHATGQLEVGPKNDVLLNEGDIIMVMAEERDIAALNARGSSR
ncbi:MAG: potassium channel protein [Dehalococcoidia bacterium]|nr:potassium channel protein [Dehalococcoidia bacterium]